MEATCLHVEWKSADGIIVLHRHSSQQHHWWSTNPGQSANCLHFLRLLLSASIPQPEQSLSPSLKKKKFFCWKPFLSVCIRWWYVWGLCLYYRLLRSSICCCCMGNHLSGWDHITHFEAFVDWDASEFVGWIVYSELCHFKCRLTDGYFEKFTMSTSRWTWLMNITTKPLDIFSSTERHSVILHYNCSEHAEGACWVYYHIIGTLCSFFPTFHEDLSYRWWTKGLTSDRKSPFTAMNYVRPSHRQPSKKINQTVPIWIDLTRMF